MKARHVLAGAGLCAALVAAAAGQAPFTAGNLVVVRVGDGAAPLTNASTAAFLVEVSPAGAVVQTIPMPVAVSAPNRAFTNSGTATSEGGLNRSADGRFLTLAGYDAAPGVATIANTASTAANRVVARVGADAVIDTTTALADASYSGTTSTAGNPRSAVTSNGTDLWIAGTAASAANGGVRYVALGGVSSVQLSSDVTNLRIARIFSGQLYCSSGAGAFRGVNTIGTGLPTTSGQATTLLPGFDPATTSTQSAYAYFLADPSTLFVADDRSAASSGGIQKWTLSGGTWSRQYIIPLGTGTAGGARGLSGVVTRAGTTLYATTTEGSNNRLVAVVDAGAGSAVTDLASSGTNTAFRGVDFAPTGAAATGACCTNSTCTTGVTQAACEGGGGVYQGDGSVTCANCSAPAPCYPNCDSSAAIPCLNVNDFSCFLNAFAAGATYANCDNSTTNPVLNVNDFSCFLNRFAAGCSAC